jgi:cob(I)alamin adenosyltransferase
MSEQNDNPPIATGGGDNGTTTLLGSGRMSKGDPRIGVLGDIDEASSSLGLARAEVGRGEIGALILAVQRLLYRIMGDVAMPQEENTVGGEDLKTIEASLEEWKARTTIPREFVVPGESRAGALLDVARCVVRRAERGLVTAGYAEIHSDALRVTNRLSDLLFVLARNADGENPLSKG